MLESANVAIFFVSLQVKALTMRVFRNILRTLLFILVISLTAAAIIVQLPSVQSRLAGRAAQWLSEATGAEVMVGEVNFVLFNRLIIKDLLIRTAPEDTLLHSKKLSVRIGHVSALEKKIVLRQVVLSEGSYHLIIQDSVTNIETLFPPSAGKDTTSRPFTWDIRSNRVILEDFAYNMINRDTGPTHNNPECMDFSDLHISDISIDIRDARYCNGVVEARLDRLSCRERSGYLVHHLEGDVTVDSKEALIKNLVIRDNHSYITAHHFLMHYGTSRNLSDYLNKVVMELDLDNAYFSFRTIGYYAWSFPEDFTLAVRATGKVTGTVSSLGADNLDIRSETGRTRIGCGFLLRGLPESEETTLQVDIDELHSDMNDLNGILYSIARVDLKNLEEATGSRTPFHFRGRLAGLLTDFAIDGDLDGHFGSLSLDMLVNNNIAPPGVLLSGVADLRDLDLGLFTGVENLGRCSLYTKASVTIREGGISSLHAVIDTLFLARLDFNQYSFQDIKMMGEFRNGIFNGKMIASDPNLQFLFQGRADLTRSAGTAADFFANIAYADLKLLNLYKNDSLAVLSGLLQADFSRINNLGDIEGTIHASGLSLLNSRGTHALDSLILESTRTEDRSRYRLVINSDALQAEYTGEEGFMGFVKRLVSRNLFRHVPSYFSSWTDYDPDSTVNGQAVFQMTVRNSVFFEEVFLPGLYIAPGTNFSLHDYGNDSIRSVIRSERLGYQDHNLRNLDILAVARPSDIRADIQCRDLSLGPLKADTLRIEAVAGNDRMNLDLFYNPGHDKKNHAIIGSVFNFSTEEGSDIPVIKAHLASDSIMINRKKWTLHSDSLMLSGGKLALNNVLLQHIIGHEGVESFLINGALSQQPEDTLFVKLSRFDASLFNTFLPASYPFTFRGSFTGQGYLTDFYGERRFMADIVGERFFVNDTLAGDLRLKSSLDPQADYLQLEASTTLPGGQVPLLATGHYHPADKKLDLKATFNHFEAAIAGPFLTGLVSDVHGKITGDMYLSGTLPYLDLVSDNTRVDKLNFTVDYTKVPYVLSGPVRLTREGLYLPKDTLLDAGGNYAIVQGGLKYRQFRDIRADLNMSFTNFQGLNLDEKDNDTFYGKAFATGNLIIRGPLNDILLDLSIRPEPNSVIHIPLSSASQARQTSLLTFFEAPVPYTGRDPYTLAAMEQKKIKANDSRLTFNMKTELTPNAEILLEINKTTGDIITARGNGVINLGVDPRDDSFSITGDCTVESGSYLFGLQGIVSKRFQILPGGTIFFNGDIETTQLNLTASYKTKASLNTLLSDTTMISNRRDVDCQILMSGNLMNPTLGFNIDIQDIDPMTRARVESALSTDDKMMRQFVTLLISSSFIPEQQSGIVNNSNILYSNATEILSNQLNNIFVQLNIPLDVGFNYQPNQRGDLFDVAISTRLFNNRVIINGNMGNNPYTRNENDLVGNVDIELKLDKKGKFRLKAFSHAADQYSNYLDNTQRSGAGFVYQEEFNTFGQLWRRWLKLP
ncbi:MAG: hypothetical protein BWX52_00283 [Bacteroidetes bacterium ADurb.Bin013]|jgi:hypothetical protein|nr:MAG: hypothetical protein BWX52_00283 [Bacteroidetes bacterium ADurb.Bin013]